MYLNSTPLVVSHKGVNKLIESDSEQTEMYKSIKLWIKIYSLMLFLLIVLKNKYLKVSMKSVPDS